MTDHDLFDSTSMMSQKNDNQTKLFNQLNANYMRDTMHMLAEALNHNSET